MEKENEKRGEGITSTEVNQGYTSDTTNNYGDLKSIYATEEDKQDFAHDN